MIAFFIRGIYPCTVGGMEIFYYHLTKELSKNENLIVITDCKKGKKTQNIKYIIVNDRLFFIKRYGFGKVSIFLSTIFQIYRYRKEIDVIHITTASSAGFFGSFFPFIKKITNIPYVVSFHGGGLYPWSKASFFPKLFKNASRSIAVSSVIKETLERRTGVPFDLVMPLIPFTKSQKTKQELRKQYGIAENARVIIMVGSLKSIKGSRFVVESFCDLGKEHIKNNEIILVLAGDGEDKATIENYIQSRGFSDYVKLTGSIPNEWIHELFALSDIYVIASEFEGTSKSLLEAMFNSLPIVASNVNGINNIIKDGCNGLLFEYNDKTSFLSKLQEINEDLEQSERIANRAKSDYENNYSFDNIVKSYKEIFEEIRLEKLEQRKQKNN